MTSLYMHTKKTLTNGPKYPSSWLTKLTINHEHQPGAPAMWQPTTWRFRDRMWRGGSQPWIRKCHINIRLNRNSSRNMLHYHYIAICNMYIYIAIYCNTVYGWKGDVWINTCFNDLDDDHLLEKTKWRYVIARAAIFEMTVEEHGSTKTTTISRRKAGQLQQQTVFYHFSACHQRPRVLASSQMPQMHSIHWSAAERRNYIHTGKLSKLLDHSKHNKLNEKSNTTGEKKGQVENIHSSRLAPFCSPETWPCIFRHLPQDHWDRRQLRLPLFSFCSLRILVAFTYSPNINLASTIPRALSIHEYPRYSNGYPMCILSILSPAFPA